ncbi:MAG: hypothetical protein JWO65_875 [Sphingomonas bacterium]|jgi:uncharacterized membrane protein YqaE (UPF0057 family)|nr:hypothetical protein [Sphingomonas bacterium]
MSGLDGTPVRRKVGIGTILCALLIPPIGVWLARGIGPAFWISLLLTILAYVPGMIFSLVAVLSPDFMAESHRLR